MFVKLFDSLSQSLHEHNDDKYTQQDFNNMVQVVPLPPQSLCITQTWLSLMHLKPIICCKTPVVIPLAKPGCVPLGF